MLYLYIHLSLKANIENVCGYMYLTDAEFAHLVEGRTLKSACIQKFVVPTQHNETNKQTTKQKTKQHKKIFDSFRYSLPGVHGV